GLQRDCEGRESSRGATLTRQAPGTRQKRLPRRRRSRRRRFEIQPGASSSSAGAKGCQPELLRRDLPPAGLPTKRALLVRLPAATPPGAQTAYPRVNLAPTSGKTPTPTSPSSSKPKLSTRRCSNVFGATRCN